MPVYQFPASLLALFYFTLSLSLSLCFTILLTNTFYTSKAVVLNLNTSQTRGHREQRIGRKGNVCVRLEFVCSVTGHKFPPSADVTGTKSRTPCWPLVGEFENGAPRPHFRGGVVPTLSRAHSLYLLHASFFIPFLFTPSSSLSRSSPDPNSFH